MSSKTCAGGSLSWRDRAGVIVQAFGVIIVSVGIAIELMLGADAGFVCITAGALGFAIGTKLKGR